MRGLQFVIVNDVNMGEKPAGATHYGPPIEGYTESWFRLTDVGFERWNGVNWGFAGCLVAKRFASLISCEQPSEWNGQGYPPVGTICELRLKTGGWGKAEIKYMSQDVCVWLWLRDDAMVRQVEYGADLINLEFSQLLSAEAISNAKREDDAIELYQAVMPDKACARWGQLGHERREHFRSLVDQGWRKVPNA